MGRKKDINDGAFKVIIAMSVVVGVLLWSFWAFAITAVVLSFVMSSLGIIR